MIATVITASLQGAELPTTDLAPTETILADDILIELESPIYSKRHAAFLRLWNTLDANDPVLLRASQSNDLAVRASARWLRVLLSLSATPGDAQKMIDDLVRVRSGDIYTLKRMAQEGRWEQLQAILNLLNPTEKQRLMEDHLINIGSRYELLKIALDDDREEMLPILIDHLWTPMESINARRWWAGFGFSELAMTPPIWIEQLATDSTASGRSDDLNMRSEMAGDSLLWEITLSEIQGDVDRAFELASKNGRSPIVYDLALKHARWDQLLSDSAKDVPPSGSIAKGDQAIVAARNSLLHGWLGNHELSEGWASAIAPHDGMVDQLDSKQLKEQDLQGLMMGLVFVGRVEEAIRVSGIQSPDEVYQSLSARGEMREAFRVIGIEDFSSESVKVWLDGQLDRKGKDFTDETKLTTRLADTGGTLARIGFPDLAKQVDQAAAQWASSGSQVNRSSRGRRAANDSAGMTSAADRWRVLFSTWSRQHRRPMALQQFKQLLREGLEFDARISILEDLYPRRQYPYFSSIAHSVLTWLHRTRGTDDWNQAVDDLEDLAMGRPLKDWPVANQTDEDSNDHEKYAGDPSDSSQAARKRSVSVTTRVGLQQLGKGILPKDPSDFENSVIPYSLAMLAVQHEQFDLAREWIGLGVDPESARWLDELFADPVRSPSMPLSLSLRSSFSMRVLNGLVELYKKEEDYQRLAIVTEEIQKLYFVRIDMGFLRAYALDKIGRFDESEYQRRSMRLIPFHPDIVSSFAQELNNAPLHRDGMAASQVAIEMFNLSRLDRLGLSWFLASYHRTAQEQLKDRSQMEKTPSGSSSSESGSDSEIADARRSVHAHRLQVLAMLDQFPQRTFDVRMYCTVRESLCRAEARLAVLEKDWKVADQQIRLAYLINPEQIETPLEMIPLAKRLMGPESAQAWSRLYIDWMEIYLQEWPDDTLFGNNLAWLYANLDQNLARAQELARRVTTLLPDDHIYLDTLAEVEYRLGNHQDALQIMRQCRSLAPLEEHYQKQIRRFLRLQ